MAWRDEGKLEWRPDARDEKARLAGVDRFGLSKIFVVYTAYIVDICIGDTLKYIFCGNDCAIMKML